jgi:WD40 repeat protein
MHHGAIMLWDVDKIVTRDDGKHRQDKVANVALSSDGRLLASGTVHGVVHLWGVETESREFSFDSASGYVLDLAFSPDSSILAIASANGAIRLWNLHTRVECGILDLPRGAASAIDFAPGGDSLALGLQDRTVTLRDVVTGTLSATIQAHLDGVTLVTFSPDGTLIASASTNKTIIVWNPAWGGRLIIPFLPYICWLGFSADGSYITTNKVVYLHPFTSSPPIADNVNNRGLYIVDVHDRWVSCNGERFIWLPLEYRNSKATIRGNTLALVTSSGKRLCFVFNFGSGVDDHPRRCRQICAPDRSPRTYARCTVQYGTQS